MQVNVLTNLLSSKISTYFSTDLTTATVITSMILTYISQLNISTFNDKLYNLSSIASYDYLVFGIIVLSIAAILTYYYKYKSSNTNNIVFPNECVYTNKLQEYMKKYPEFYNQNYDSIYLDSDRIFGTPTNIPNVDSKVYFVDKNFEISGYITTTCEIEKNDDKKTIKLYNIILTINNNQKFNALQYINQICEHVNSEHTKNSSITLRNIRPLKTEKNGIQTQSYVFYKGPKINDHYEKYIKTYFNKQRDEIWNFVKNVHYTPEIFRNKGQEARVSYLFHGPPGTGKSSFVYRMAMALNRSIISLNLKEICHDKAYVYQCIQHYTGSLVDLEPKDCIILFEEFDISIEYLLEKNRKVHLGHANQSGHAGHSFVVPSEAMATDIKENPSDNGLQIEDLLEILQGPVPIPNSIIIATTNKYDEIRRHCPAIFRPGRMTPVEFGFIDWNSLQELSQHYFGKTLTMEPIEIKISTSEIIEKAIYCLLQPNSFELFESFIKSRLVVK